MMPYLALCGGGAAEYAAGKRRAVPLKSFALALALRRMLRSGALRADELVLFVDAFDVVFVRPAHHLAAALRRALLATGKPILFSGERNCWPWPHSAPAHGSLSSNTFAGRSWAAPLPRPAAATELCARALAEAPGARYPFLNSGMFGGGAAALVQAWSE